MEFSRDERVRVLNDTKPWFVMYPDNAGTQVWVCDRPGGVSPAARIYVPRQWLTPWPEVNVPGMVAWKNGQPVALRLASFSTGSAAWLTLEGDKVTEARLRDIYGDLTFSPSSRD